MGIWVGIWSLAKMGFYKPPLAMVLGVPEEWKVMN